MSRKDFLTVIHLKISVRYVFFYLSMLLNLITFLPDVNQNIFVFGKPSHKIIHINNILKFLWYIVLIYLLCLQINCIRNGVQSHLNCLPLFLFLSRNTAKWFFYIFYLQICGIMCHIIELKPIFRYII